MIACAVLAAGCGRLGFNQEQQPPSDAASDVASDVAIDMSPDAAVCAADTTPILAGSMVCIEKAQRGDATWTNARASCIALGRRLCTDFEWFAGCVNAVGVTDMFGDNYEWVAEESSGVAQKRGASSCNDMSAHEIFVDPYGYRCCTEVGH